MSSGHIHSSSNSTLMTMSTMEMIFFTSTLTPLYSRTWAPTSAGSYVGTCVFLVILATIFRSLFATKLLLEQRWLDRELNRRYIVVRGMAPEAERIAENSDAKNGTLITERGVEEHVKVVRRRVRAVTPWRFSVDLPRAAFVTIMTAVGYLLLDTYMFIYFTYMTKANDSQDAGCHDDEHWLLYVDPWGDLFGRTSCGSVRFNGGALGTTCLKDGCDGMRRFSTTRCWGAVMRISINV